MKERLYLPTEQKISPFSKTALHEQAAQADRAADQLLTQLLQEKGRFSSVFQTENESYYFVLNDGSCLRIQKTPPHIRDDDDGNWRTRPIADHVLFINPQGLEKLQHLRDHPGFALNNTQSPDSRTIFLSSLQLGAIPFEYGFSDINQGIRPVFKIDGLTAVYLGSEKNNQIIPLNLHHNPDISSYPIGATHIGHPISRIVWP